MKGEQSVPEHRLHRRGGEEFGRVLALSDGLFAIAMTLLVISIAVPTLSDADSVGELANALNDDVAAFVSFVISFAVIGRYWAAHHEFFAQLAVIDRSLVGLNLVYLCFVAFLPFPTALLGTYFENPLSVVVYALAVSAVSGMEVVLFRHAHRHRLMTRQMPEEVYRWGTMVSLTPLAFFALSMPLAFVNTTLAVLCWFLAVPFGIWADRRKPARADQFL